MNHNDFMDALWMQFGAAIDALENAIRACPDKVWDDRTLKPEFWYTAYHTLFWLDYYLADSPTGFSPPAPFGMEEMDPAGVLPERVYSQDELLRYLQHGRIKCRTLLAGLTPVGAAARYISGKIDFSRVEILLYTMRHVQHHAGQLNLLLRQTVDAGSRWTFQAKQPLRFAD